MFFLSCFGTPIKIEIGIDENGIILGLIALWLMGLIWLLPNVIRILREDYRQAHSYLEEIHYKNWDNLYLDKCQDKIDKLEKACERIIKYYKLATCLCVDVPLFWLMGLGVLFIIDSLISLWILQRIILVKLFILVIPITLIPMIISALALAVYIMMTKIHLRYYEVNRCIKGYKIK